MPGPVPGWEPPDIEPTWLVADRRPDGVDDDTVEALGTVGEAIEWMERARGHLYAFHQMCGRVDLLMGDAAEQLDAAGHGELAGSLRTHVVGRNVLEGRWSFQIVEEYDATYWSVLHDFARHARDELAGGWDHVYESEMKDDRRTGGRRRHERRPDPDG